MPFKKNGKYRTIDGEMKLLQKKGEFLFSTEIWLLNDAVNRNGWQYTDMAGNMAQFAGTPVLIAYVNDGKTCGDGHNFRMETDPMTGEPAPSFTDATAERIVGAISEDPNDIRLEQRDGNTWIVARAALWRWYAKELVEKIERDARQGRAMSISIETLVTKSHMEGDVEVEDEYLILGTTILGDHVMPAVADAHIAALAKKERFQELKMRAASYDQGADPENKPHQNNNEKGLNVNMKTLGKRQFAELAARFAEYTVLAAGIDNDGGVHVCMLNGAGDPCTYDMASLDETIIPDRVSKVTVNASFVFGEEHIDVDVCAMTDSLSAGLVKANSDLEKANKALTEANDKINAMQEAETTRRLNSAKNTAKATLEAFNANREQKIDASVLDAVNADIEKGLYTNCVSESGEWTGDTAVENAVYAVCGRKVAENDAQTAKRYVSFGNGVKTNSGDAGTIGDLFHN